MSVHCFFHKADLDGHCSGAIVQRFYGSHCIMHPYDYGQDFPWREIDIDDTVVMVDVSLQPYDTMRRLAGACDLIWIDHHSSAIEALNGLRCGGIQDTTVAACESTWRFFYPAYDMPQAVFELGVYDSWRHGDNPNILAFQKGMQIENTEPSTGASLPIWDRLLGDVQTELHGQIMTRGAAVNNYLKQKHKTQAETCAFPTTLSHDGQHLQVIACNAFATGSSLFDSVWDESKYEAMLVFYRRKDLIWRVSMYSTKTDVDCGAWATKFGGGGHRGAAGFQCDRLPWDREDG